MGQPLATTMEATTLFLELKQFSNGL